MDILNLYNKENVDLIYLFWFTVFGTSKGSVDKIKRFVFMEVKSTFFMSMHEVVRHEVAVPVFSSSNSFETVKTPCPK